MLLAVLKARTMSDDIDIEEHDVLDNPNIRRIFPDLSIIKKEIFEYEEGLNNDVKEKAQAADNDGELQEEAADPHHATDLPTTSEISANTEETLTSRQLEVRRRFKYFLDSLVDDFIENNENNSDTNSNVFKDIVTSDSPKLVKTEKTFRKAVKPIQNNKIVTSDSPKLVKTEKTRRKTVKPIRNNNIVILGSKPNGNAQHSKKVDKVKKQLKIVLKNVSPYLNASKRYCKDCFILFPNLKEFKCHIDNIHSIKTSSDVIKTKKLEKCKICNIEMLSTNLPRHYKRIHTVSKPDNPVGDITRSLRGRTKLNETNTLTSEQTKAESDNNYNCFHCQNLFTTRSALIEHLYEVLNPYKMVTKDLPKNETTKNPDITDDKHSDDEKLVTSEKNVKRQKKMSASTEGSSDKISNNKNKLTENVVQKTSRKENKPELNENQLSSSQDNLKKPIKCNSIEREESIENNDNELLLDHNMDSQSSDEFMCDIDQNNSAANSSHNVAKPKNEVYQCFICSQYMILGGPYFRHMGSHNITKDFIRDIDKTTFDGQCHFCSSKKSTIKAYNSHIWKTHRAKYVQKVNLDEKASQSVMFKCFKCDVFFLSVDAAIKHFEHDKILADWKCSKCNELFKIRDKFLHLKQHEMSKNITPYVLSESALRRVLYKCLKCTVHFSEKEYFLHNTCDLEIPNSAYCKTCDILINTNDMEFHESNHKKKLQLIDFPLIETEIILNEVKKCTVGKTNPYAQSPFALTFCDFCNCFLNNISRSRTVHTSGQCATVILPKICRKCGLVFTASGLRAHQTLHTKMKNINMQSFYFYDNKTNEQIAPPVPKQPNCNICGVHFMSKSAIVGHECSKQSFTICNVCNIKFTHAAFKLHINYHQYKLSSSVLNKTESSKLKVEGAKEPASIASNINTVQNVSLEKQTSFNSDEDNLKETQKLFYTCIPCNITLDSYDKVVQHCHEHYDYTKIQSGHKKIDVYDKSDVKSAVVVRFDPFYFRFNHNVWIEHIFANLTKVQIDNVLKDSMYKFEHRNKMEEIQPGPSNMVLYKCDMCRSLIDPNKIYFHASDACSIMSKKYPCLSCGLCFYTEKYRTIHEKDHDRPHITALSYRIILFNKIEHQNFNKVMYDSHTFILYQCRKCQAIVDKLQCDIHKCNYEKLMKCATCGLLFYKNEFYSHLTKHEIVKQFQSDQMVIIMFGKLGFHMNNKQMNSFSGTIYDLTFYRCTNCGLCLKTETDKANHVCVPKSYITQCPKCYLYFMKKEMKEHLKFHENNLILGYDDFNSNIVTFSNNEQNIVEASTSQTEKEKDERNDNTDKLSIQTIYKCNCGLHFLEKTNVIKHHNNCSAKMKISKQSCIKCDLLFTPGELFDHLLKHHSNKKLRYKYDIINISEVK